MTFKYTIFIKLSNRPTRYCMSFRFHIARFCIAALFLAPLLRDESIQTALRAPAQSNSLWSKCTWIDRKKNNTFKACRPSGFYCVLPVTYSKFLSGNNRVSLYTICTD